MEKKTEPWHLSRTINVAHIVGAVTDLRKNSS